MKKIKLYSFLVATLFVVSCEDAIDISQPGELYPEVAFQSVADLQIGLRGVYASTPGENGITFTSTFTDETAVGRSNGGQGISNFQFIMNANHGTAASVWNSNYRMINLATRLIIAAENVSYSDSEEAAYKHTVAQAHALRALGHLQLLTYFAPDLKDDNGLGVIKIDFIPSITDKLPRNTVGEVFELIEADINFAEANLNDVSTPLPSPVYINKNFVSAFKARMYAYRGNYTQAQIYADQVIAAYPLTTGLQYQNIWRDLNNGEVIFKLERNAANISGANFYQAWSSANSTVAGSPFLEVNRALFNLIDNNNDVRKNVIVDPTALIVGDYSSLSLPDYLDQDVLPVGKYSISKGIFLLGDIKVFRASEAYFIKAEALAAAGNLTGVADLLHLFRTNRITGLTDADKPVYANAAQAWADILKERRIELAFEGHRYIDLKRLRSLAGVGIDRDPMDCSLQGFPCDLSSQESYKWTLPIPLLEVNVNTNIQQNTGY